VLVENYTTVKATFSGTSLNGYDHVAGRWHQCWMDTTGLVLDLYGNPVDGQTPSGAKVAWFADLDGNTLSLTEH